MLVLDSHFHLNYLNSLKLTLEKAIKKNVVTGIVAGVWNEDTLENLSFSMDPNLNSILCFLSKEMDIKNSFDLNKFSCFLSHGLHPMYVHEKWILENGKLNNEKISNDLSEFNQILLNNKNKIWAIGETGFDLSNDILKHKNCNSLTKQNLIEIQNIAFENCIQAAINYKLPVILHLRAPWNLCIQKIKWAKNQGVNNMMIHCYSGPAEELKILSKLSIYCSFGAVPTWQKATKNRDAFLKCDPLFRMLETDSPDLPPEIPGVGKLTENEPANLIEISKILAAHLNKTDIELIKSSNENAFRFLGIF
nr:TatD family hydrolase [Silvanigrella paludirubra]